MSVAFAGKLELQWQTQKRVENHIHRIACQRDDNRVMRIQSGDSKLEIKYVVVGEVWSCSGKTTWSLGSEIVSMAQQNLRRQIIEHFCLRQTPKRTAPIPRLTMETTPWLVCNPTNIKVGPWMVACLAVGYYFWHVSVHRETKVPVGMIQAAWYGTPIEPWIGPEAYRQDPDIRRSVTCSIKNNAEYALVALQYYRAYAAWEKAVDKAKASGTTLPPQPPCQHDYPVRALKSLSLSIAIGFCASPRK